MTTYSTGEHTKRKIINAAGELAAELGLDNVSTRAIAEASGENIGSIHYHFGSKEGLFEAVVQDAIGCCQIKLDDEAMDQLGDSPTREALSRAVRGIVEREINDLFRSKRPLWHSLLIYRLLQRDDALSQMFHDQVLDPGMRCMVRFFGLVDPGLSREEAFLHTIILKMPIFAHTNYRKAMLRWLKKKDYSDAYLRKLEDMLVKQTQLLLGLPLDQSKGEC